MWGIFPFECCRDIRARLFVQYHSPGVSDADVLHSPDADNAIQEALKR